MENKARQRVQKVWREWLRPLLVVLVILFSVRSSVADWNDVPTGSMKPTILEGDRIFVNKLAYDLRVPFVGWRLIRWANPERGDVVVFSSPADGTRLVKRVVGLPGDVIEVVDNQVRVNGRPAAYLALEQRIADEVAAAERPRHRFAAERFEQTHPVMFTPAAEGRPFFGPVTVPAGHYFMMGDNRDNSLDSRMFGFVPRGSIVGHATAVALSFGDGPRWHRFFRKMD